MYFKGGTQLAYDWDLNDWTGHKVLDLELCMSKFVNNKICVF